MVYFLFIIWKRFGWIKSRNKAYLLWLLAQLVSSASMAASGCSTIYNGICIPSSGWAGADTSSTYRSFFCRMAKRHTVACAWHEQLASHLSAQQDSHHTQWQSLQPDLTINWDCGWPLIHTMQLVRPIPLSLSIDNPPRQGVHCWRQCRRKIMCWYCK